MIVHIPWKCSRFGRNRTGNQLNLARVEKAGGELVSATEEVDARTAVGELTRGMLFELAAFESDRAGEQWGEAFQNRVARGLPPLGRAQFGYIRRGRVRHPLHPERTIAAPEDGPERYEPDYASGLAGMFAECYERWIVDRNFSRLVDWLNDSGARMTTYREEHAPASDERAFHGGWCQGLYRGRLADICQWHYEVDPETNRSYKVGMLAAWRKAAEAAPVGGDQLDLFGVRCDARLRPTRHVLPTQGVAAQ